jgi:hypothetical protein
MSRRFLLRTLLAVALTAAGLSAAVPVAQSAVAPWMNPATPDQRVDALLVGRLRRRDPPAGHSRAAPAGRAGRGRGRRGRGDATALARGGGCDLGHRSHELLWRGDRV